MLLTKPLDGEKRWRKMGNSLGSRDDHVLSLSICGRTASAGQILPANDHIAIPSRQIHWQIVLRLRNPLF